MNNAESHMEEMLKRLLEKESEKENENDRVVWHFGNNVENMRQLDPDDKKLLDEIRSGNKREYRVFARRIEKKKHFQALVDNYNRLLKENRELRDQILYKKVRVPLRVTLKRKSENMVPVDNIQKLELKQKMVLLENVMAAMARKQHNPEVDSILQIRCFVLGKEDIVVVVAIYPYMLRKLSTRQLLVDLFYGVPVVNGDYETIEKENIHKINEQIIEKNQNFWKNIIRLDQPVLYLPGEIKDHKGYDVHKKSVFRRLSPEMVEKIRQYAKENKVSEKAVMFSAWGIFMNEYYGQEESCIGYLRKGEMLDFYPVPVRHMDSVAETVFQTEKNIEEAEKHENCDIRFLEQTIGKKLEDYFRFVHNFIEIKDDEEANESIHMLMNQISFYPLEEINFGLRINYHMIGKSINLNYVYRNDRFYEVGIEKIHEAYLHILDDMLLGEKNSFDKESYISAADSDTEKLYKLEVAQKAVWLKECGLFEKINSENLMELAKLSHSFSYGQNDVVWEEHKFLSDTAILVDGMLEESIMDPGGIISSMRIVKKGAVIGLEALTDYPVAGSTFTVAGFEARLLFIPRELMKAYIRHSDYGLERILDIQNKRIQQLQKLWSMQ